VRSVPFSSAAAASAVDNPTEDARLPLLAYNGRRLGLRTERARHFARRGQRQSFDQIEPKAGIACPLIEFDPRYASVPKIFAEHYTLDSADAFLVRLNMPRGAPNKCELLHTAQFLSRAGLADRSNGHDQYRRVFGDDNVARAQRERLSSPARLNTCQGRSISTFESDRQ